jgi:hypothetical protein
MLKLSLTIQLRTHEGSEVRDRTSSKQRMTGVTDGVGVKRQGVERRCLRKHHQALYICSKNVHSDRL